MKQYYRKIIFTKVPLGGYYRYRDFFQIFPAEFQDMPDNPYKEHYPNILEYWFTEEEKIIRKSEYENLNELFTLTATTVTKEDKIISLLNSFTNNTFFKYDYHEGVWAIPILYNRDNGEISEEINKLSPQWSMRIFHFPTLPSQLQITEFTELSVKEIPRIPHNLFYTIEPNLDNDRKKAILLPITIDMILDSYFSLDKEIMSIIDAALGFNVAAVELRTTKRTLALLSSFTAVETMINLEYREQEVEKCKGCNQPRFSIARKFREYLLKYIGDSPENKKKFNSYYNFRCKIVHTGMRLKAEVLFSDYSAEEIEEEFITRIEILQLGKLAIANWLLKNKKS
jgi:hypothetical protein